MFIYKTESELAKMTAEERDKYAKDKREHEKKLMEEAVKLAVEGIKSLNEEQKKEVDEAIKEAIKKAGTGGITEAQFKEIQESIKEIKESSQKNIDPTNDPLKAIEEGLKEFLPKIKAHKAGMGESTQPWEMEMTVKAAVNITTSAIANDTGVTTPVNYVYQSMNGQYAEDVRAVEYIINYLTNGTTNKASLPFMDKLPTEGTMEITAEGALKPLISISFKLNYSQAVKIAGRTKISEEALDDIPQIMSIIRSELAYEHAIAEQEAIFAKVASFAPGFVAGSLAGTTVEPSNYDAIRAGIYAIKIASKGRFVPNAVVVPSADVYAMGATKDANNNYVLPPFVLPDGTRISGVRIIEDANGGDYLEDGEFILGDWKKLKRYIYKSFTVRIGQGINNIGTSENPIIVSDFESNMYTIIGESRQHLWIYENEQVAFLKSTFSAVKTAIEAVVEEEPAPQS